MSQKIIYIRAETIKNEYRTPLNPLHINILINNGFIVYIQSSLCRIYKDTEYIENGGIITSDEWYSSKFKNALIIGIKELFNLDKLENHTHIYFSHTFKNQINSEYILTKFINSNSKLHDFEYILDNHNKRIIAFGLYSGLVGGILGIKQYYNKINNIESISNLTPWYSYEDMINSIKLKAENIQFVNIAIIGGYGRCGNGVKIILESLNLSYIIIDRTYDINNLIEFDIIFNCILLEESYDKTWFDQNTKFEKNLVIVDISCDYSRLNNPIKLYNKATSWEEPIYKYNKFVDIIGIDNLPSLLPKESSDFFSNKLLHLLLDYKLDVNNYWKNSLSIYHEKALKFYHDI